MIEIVNKQRRVRVGARRVARIARAALAALGKDGKSLTVALVNDRSMRELNRVYRKKDSPTDVLSFASSSGRDLDRQYADESDHMGDVAISVETAQRQAREAGHGLTREIDELVLHGVLHLCGYDHETDGGEMNRLELKLRRKLLDQR